MNANFFSGSTLHPPDRNLLGVFSEVLSHWAFLDVEAAGKPEPEPVALALEVGLVFFGEREGRLVLRSSAQLGRRLVEIALGEAGADEDAGRDALGELCNLVGKHLASRTLSGEGARMQSSVPEISSPQDWPAAVPIQSVAMRVDGEPLEARVWLWQPVRARDLEL
jgi:hypothetical protein